MSVPQSREPSQGRQSLPVTAHVLEERINMYISAMDKASAMNNSQHSSQLQQDIQLLVDLMEKVSSGQTVPESEVPPPLDITPQNDTVANPLGEISSRMSEYHKALYFAEEELSEQRINKIKDLQKGLQLMHTLQKRAQDGFPIRADEIPPSVPIPDDCEFDNDAVTTITTRISQYKEVLSTAQNGSDNDRRKIPKMESALRTLEFLLTRANSKRPVWKKDIPQEFEYCEGNKDEKVNKAKLVLLTRSLLVTISKIINSLKNEGKKQECQSLRQKVQDIDKVLTSNPPQTELKQIHSSLLKMKMDADSLEKYLANETITAGQTLMRTNEDLTLLETRMLEYKNAALNAKKDNQVENAIKHFKVLKGLHALKEKLQKGVAVDMTLVPPPPPVMTPVTDSQPPSLSADNSIGSVGGGATASVSSVTIRPPMETAEDRLAKQLSSYLTDTTVEVPGVGSAADAADDVDTAAPPSSSHENVTQAYTSGFETTDTTIVKSGEMMRDAGSFTLSKTDLQPIDSVSESFDNIGTSRTMEEASNGAEKKLISSNDNFSEVSNKMEETEVVLNPSAGLASSEGNPTFSETISNESVTASVNQKTNSIDNPNIVTNGAKSADSNKKNALDNVGFLSCQNIQVINNQNSKNISSPSILESESSDGGKNNVQESIISPPGNVQMATNQSIEMSHTDEQTHMLSHSNNTLGNDDFEFQDLMNSMSLPDMSAQLPASLPDMSSQLPQTFNNASSLSPEFHSLPAEISNQSSENKPYTITAPTLSLNKGSDLKTLEPVGVSNGIHNSLVTYSEVKFRCLENIKYDFLLAENKGSHEEAEKLRLDMEAIKAKLRKGGRQVWDVYTNCVKSELQSTEEKLEVLRASQCWEDVQFWTQRKSLVERELAVLRVRLCELKY